MRAWFKWKRKARDSRELGPPEEPMRVIGEQELQARFLEAPGSRLFAAVLAVCDDEAQEQLEQCLDEGLSNEVLRYRVGAVAGVQQVKARLLEYEREAKRTESEPKETDEEERTEA